MGFVKFQICKGKVKENMRGYCYFRDIVFLEIVIIVVKEIKNIGCRWFSMYFFLRGGSKIVVYNFFYYRGQGKQLVGDEVGKGQIIGDNVQVFGFYQVGGSFLYFEQEIDIIRFIIEKLDLLYVMESRLEGNSQFSG